MDRWPSLGDGDIRRQTDHREQETYIGHRIYLYHGSNGCSSRENMHIFFEVICGIGASIVDIV